MINLHKAIHSPGSLLSLRLANPGPVNPLAWRVRTIFSTLSSWPTRRDRQESSSWRTTTSSTSPVSITGRPSSLIPTPRPCPYLNVINGATVPWVNNIPLILTIARQSQSLIGDGQMSTPVILFEIYCVVLVHLNIWADQVINEVVQLLIQDTEKTSINYKFSPAKKREIDRVVYPNLNSSNEPYFPAHFTWVMPHFQMIHWLFINKTERLLQMRMYQLTLTDKTIIRDAFASKKEKINLENSNFLCWDLCFAALCSDWQTLVRPGLCITEWQTGCTRRRSSPRVPPSSSAARLPGWPSCPSTIPRWSWVQWSGSARRWMIRRGENWNSDIRRLGGHPREIVGHWYTCNLCCSSPNPEVSVFVQELRPDGVNENIKVKPPPEVVDM